MPPAFSAVRQSLAASVPDEHQRPAFALDAMSTEVAYAVGPALGTLVAIALPGRPGLWAVGGAFVLASAALARLNPPLRLPGTAGEGRTAPPVRSWLRGPMLVALASTGAAILMLTATELAVVAGLTARGETAWFALANAVWCAASLTGGWISRRSPAPAPDRGAAGPARARVAAGRAGRALVDRDAPADPRRRLLRAGAGLGHRDRGAPGPRRRTGRRHRAAQLRAHGGRGDRLAPVRRPDRHRRPGGRDRRRGGGHLAVAIAAAAVTRARTR